MRWGQGLTERQGPEYSRIQERVGAGRRACSSNWTERGRPKPCVGGSTPPRRIDFSRRSRREPRPRIKGAATSRSSDFLGRGGRRPERTQRAEAATPPRRIDFSGRNRRERRLYSNRAATEQGAASTSGGAGGPSTALRMVRRMVSEVEPPTEVSASEQRAPIPRLRSGWFKGW